MFNILKGQKNIIVVCVLTIFLLSFLIHWFIYWSKGFVITEYFNLVIARNWAQTDEISYESEKNVILSSVLIKSEGEFANLGNKLIFLLYGLFFKIFGFHPDLPVYLTFILYSVSAVFLFLIAWRIFNFIIGFTVAIFGIVAPFFLPASNTIGHHEWAYLFLILAAFFNFLFPVNKYARLILTGIFLGLMLAAKNSFFVAIPPFLILEIWQGRSDLKKAFLNAGVIVIFSFLLSTPFILYSGNAYFFDMSQNQEAYQPSAIFNDFYPDAYTFNYDRSNYLVRAIQNRNTSVIGNFYFWGKFGPTFLSGSVWFGWLLPIVFSAWIYFKGLFLSYSIFGGFLSWFFISLASVYLLKIKNKVLIIFCTSFFASWFLGLIFFRTSNYSHFLILTLPASLLLGIGIYKLADMVSLAVRLPKISAQKILFSVVIFFLVLYLQISWSAIGKLYQNSNFTNEVFNFARSEKNKAYFSQPSAKNEVIAVGWSREVPAMLNYYLNGNFVGFAPETIEKLAGQDKLGEVFGQYKITGFVGYNKQLTEIINKNTDNKLINYSASIGDINFN